MNVDFWVKTRGVAVDSLKAFIEVLDLAFMNTYGEKHLVAAFEEYCRQELGGKDEQKVEHEQRL